MYSSACRSGAIALGLLLISAHASATPVVSSRIEPLPGSAAIAGTEVVLVPPAAREPVLMAAHHAYTVWSQQFMGTLLQPEQTTAWKEFLGMDIRLGDAYRQMGQSSFQEGRLEDTIKMLSVAKDFLPEDPDMLAALGYAQKETGRYEDAIVNLKRASELKGAEALVWLWLGDAYRLMGNYEESYRALLTARDLASEEQTDEFADFVSYTERLMDLAPSWDNFETHRDFLGRHNDARRSLRMVDEYVQALKVAPPVAEDDKDNLFKLGWVHLQMGTQYAFIKQPALAVDHYLQSKDFYTRAGSDSDLMRIHQNLALAYEALAARYPQKRIDYLEAAAASWETSLEAARTAGDAEYTRHSQGGLLAVLASLKPMDDEKVVALRAALAKEIPWRGPINEFSIASATRGEAACRLVEGDLGGARTLIEMADSYYEGTGFLVDLELRSESLVQLAEIYLAQEHAQQAIASANQAITQVTGLREYLDTDGFLRSGNGHTLRRATTAVALGALREGSPEQAFEAIESYQTQLADDLLGSRVRDEAWRTDFATEEKLLLEREGWYRSELDKATAARDTARVDWLNERLEVNAARVKRLALADSLPAASQISYRSVVPLTALQAQAALTPDTTILHITTGEAGGVAVMMNGAEVRGIPLPEARGHVVAKAVDALRTACNAGDDSAAATHAETLRKVLLEPLASILPATGSLAFSGDALTKLLPLRLLDPEGTVLPLALKVFNSSGASFLDRVASVRRGKAVTGLEVPAGDTPAAQLTAPVASGGARISVALDLNSEDPTLALWSPLGNDSVGSSMLTAHLLAHDLTQGLIALDLEITGGKGHTTQQHFASLGELMWRSGCGAVVLNQWAVAPEVRETFFTTMSDALLSSPPLDAFQIAQDAVRLTHPKSTDWAAFVYLGAP